MSEREMLERAAAAAGYVIERWAQDDYPIVRDGDRQYGWNPLVFDSDALRLAVRLGLTAHHYLETREVGVRLPYCDEDIASEFYADDPEAATRLAITRAAAALAPTAQGEWCPTAPA